jgi:hypothetical protein
MATLANLAARFSRAGALRISTRTEPSRSVSGLDLMRYAVLVVAWVGAAALALYWKRSQLLIGFDGAYIFDLARRQIEWRVPFFSASLDWFQGLGDVFFAINFRFLPAYVAGMAFSNVVVTKIVIYLIVLCELSFTTLLFGLTLGVSRAVAMTAVAATCLLLFPFAKPTLTYGLLPIIPHFGTLIAVALLTATAFIRFGRRKLAADLPFAVIASLCVAWSVLISITFIIISAPFLLLCVTAATIGAQSVAERRCKLGLLVLLCLIGASPGLYLGSTLVDSAATVFSKELIASTSNFFDSSILFHPKYLCAAAFIADRDAPQQQSGCVCLGYDTDEVSMSQCRNQTV